MTEETDAPAVEQTNSPDGTPTPQPGPTNTPAEAETQAEAEATDAGTETPEAEDKPKREPWWQKRIDEVTKARREAERERDAAMALLKSRDDDPAKTPEERDIDALATRKAEQIAAAKAFNDRCNTVYAEGAKAFTDFDDAVKTLSSTGVMEPSFIESVLETDAPAKVLHYLGQNPDEAVRVSELPARRQAIELDRLSVRLGGEGKPISNAPAPLRPLSRTTGKATFDPADPQSDVRDWMKWREAELAKLRA